MILMGFLLQRLERFQEPMRFRPLNLIEETILKRSFSNWGIFEYYCDLNIFIGVAKTGSNGNDAELPPLDDNSTNNSKEIDSSLNAYQMKRIQKLLSAREDKKVYVCSGSFKQLDSFLEQDIVSLGLQIGIIRKKKFVLGLNFAELVLNKKRGSDLNFPHVIITEKAANLACFGRDIMGNSIISCYPEIGGNQILLILNQDNELVGIGRSRFPTVFLFRPNIVTVDTLEDVGTHYLQAENSGLE